MADLCSRVEPPIRSCIKVTTSSLEAMVTKQEKASAVDMFPVRCDELQCLFCIGNDKLDFKDRTRRFCKLQALWSHAENHLNKLRNGEISCSHPYCKTQAVTLKSVEHLLNYAQREHNIRLRSR